MQRIFFNESGLLRSGWRAAIFISIFVFVVVVLGVAAQMILTAVGIHAAPGTNLFLLINGVISLGPALIIGWLCGKYLENLPYAELGASFIRGWLSHWTAGVLLGAITLCVAVLIAVMFGGLRFEANTGDGQLVTSLAMSVAIFGIAAAFEEALFRGYVLQTFARSGLAWLAILLTSLFFAAVHLGNPSASFFSTFNTVLAGVWFGIAYLKTRDLWFVWGIHLAWNWVQGSIFGIEVSGLSGLGGEPLLREIDAGPTWLTGDAYGIEGGLACTVAILVSIGVIWALPMGRNTPVSNRDNSDTREQDARASV